MKIQHLFLAAIFFSLSSLHANAAPGDLDPTFGNGGKLVDEGLIGYTRRVAIQSDGKIVVVGNWVDSGYLFVRLVRYHPNGTPDTMFGNGGKVTTDIGFYGYSIAIQPDGKIVVAGGAGSNFAVARYNPNGGRDTTFDGDGVVTTSFGVYSIGSSVTIQPDQKILVAGGAGGDFAVVRYNIDGSLDTTFGSGGKVTTDVAGDNNVLCLEEAYSVAIQFDGKIVVPGQWGCGKYGGGGALVRYNTDGSLDTTFGSGGMVFSSWYSGDVAIQPDGKIVTPEARYNTNGSLDTLFEAIGVSWSVSIQADGKILAAGSMNWPDNDFGIVRYNADGSRDTTFGGGDGISSVDFNSPNDDAYGMALDRQGRAVVVGNSNGSAAIARFLLASHHQLSGRVTTSSKRGIKRAYVTLDDGAGNERFATTNSFGYFRFVNVPTGTYTASVRSTRYIFTPRTISVSSSVTGLDFVAFP